HPRGRHLGILQPRRLHPPRTRGEARVGPPRHRRVRARPPVPRGPGALRGQPVEHLPGHRRPRVPGQGKQVEARGHHPRTAHPRRHLGPVVEPAGLDQVSGFLDDRDNLDGLGRMVAVRTVIIAVTTVFVSFVMFGLAALSPFDPLASYLGTGYAELTEAERADVAAAIGADLPWWRQWLDWIAGVFTGDLGFARSYGRAGIDVLSERLA